MSSTRDHFKEPLAKLDQLIDKLQTNLGQAAENPTAEHAHTKHAKEPEVPAKVEKPVEEVKPTTLVEEKKAQTKAEAPPAPAAEVPKKDQGKTVKPKEEKPKEEKPKEPKEPKPKEPATVVVEKPKDAHEQLTATVDDFLQLDIRIGNITECWKHPSSENLYCEKINIGDEVREIASGLQKYVPIDQMSGPVLVFTNLKARKLADFMSNGMVMANSDKDRNEIKLITPKGKVGERIVLDGFKEKFSQDKQPQLNPKKKILEKCIDKFTTDAEGLALWNGHKLMTSEGYIQCPIKNGLLS